ncbi:hypothetical protein [Flavobacterium maritimum]|uniref:hypothetical protein n=1 Tax=Flavobacterium maritimum TaxID=3149042 RepID=UPI0032B3620C
MKKLLVLFVAVVFMSCSEDQFGSSNSEGQASLSVLDGELLSFKDDESFIKEYSVVSEMKTEEEVQSWISKKGLKSLLNTLYDSIDMQNDVLDNERIIYSDAIKAILNRESKFKINGNIIWANRQNLYLLNDDNSDFNNQELLKQINSLKIYGNILNKSGISKSNNISNETSRLVIPNENRSKDWSISYNSAGRDRRIILTLFNETIVLNSITSSSKMFIKCLKQGKYCSFWKCNWNQEFEPIQLQLTAQQFNPYWLVNTNIYSYGDITNISSSNTTILLSTSTLSSPSNFWISSGATVTTWNGSARTPYTWNQYVTWY